MKDDFPEFFNVQRYIESVAYSKANMAFKRHGQNRADFVYNQTLKRGARLWAELTAQLPRNEAEIWFRKLLGSEEAFEPDETGKKSSSKTTVKLGPECWAKNAVEEYKSIIKKVDDSINGSKSQNRREMQLKTAVNNAEVWLAVKPAFYKAERHGEWICENLFKSMMKNLCNIVAKYAAVCALKPAA